MGTAINRIYSLAVCAAALSIIFEKLSDMKCRICKEEVLA